MSHAFQSACSRRTLLARAALAGALAAGGDLRQRLTADAAASTPPGYPAPNPAVVVLWPRPWRWRTYLGAYALVAPALALLILYVFVPIGYTIYISFQDVHLGAVSYVGAANPNAGGYVNPNAHVAQSFFGTRNWYNLFFHDTVFAMALRNTVVMVVGATLLGVVGALTTALVATQRLPFIGVFRTAYFFPAAISRVVTA